MKRRNKGITAPACPGSRPRRAARPAGSEDLQLSSAARAAPREHVLPPTVSVTHSIADAIVLKEGDLFFLAEPGGFVPLADHHGLGLYYHDCRYLNGYALTLAGVRPDVLVSTTVQGLISLSQLTTPDILMDDGRLLKKDDLGIKRERVIQPDPPVFHDLLTFHNYGAEPIAFPIALTFQAGFEDIFVVRGMVRTTQGKHYLPEWQAEKVLQFTYEGADSVWRCLAVHFSTRPSAVADTTAHFHLHVPPRQSTSLLVSLAVAESSNSIARQPSNVVEPDINRVQVMLKRSSDEWLAGETEIRSNSLALNAVVDRSLRDLRVLRSKIGTQEYFAAGIPWFATLFGRDSLITAIQTLAYDPGIAEQTLRVLASYQGEQDNAWRDEEPGKILHELRLGETARTGEVPHSPYYGTIDATPLFLALIGWHATWTGDLALFHELRPNVERALEWIARYGDLDGDGYLEYLRRSEAGLTNQGWKDSGDGIPNADGSLAEPPLALAEVQGYVYRAKLNVAELFRRAGEDARADALLQEAAALRRRFNADFWLRDKEMYALALQKDKRPVAVAASNAGHALWADIAEPDKARRTMQRLMADDMFSGWGVRTLSEQEVAYNPTGYHLGTVWPHDNAFIAAGFQRYGFAEAALKIFQGIIEAAMQFPGYRLPELFMGFPRGEYEVPVSYPVACRPQAWAAGTVPYLVLTLLGLSADAFERRLWIRRPVLPPFVHYIEVRRLRVGNSSVDLRFERNPSGTVAVEVLAVQGQTEVVMELAAPLAAV